MTTPVPPIEPGDLASPGASIPGSPPDTSPAIRRYRITHETRFQYSAPVSLDQTVLRLQPRTSVLQHLRDFTMTVDPKPARHTHGIDLHGNIRHWLWFDQQHSDLTITTESTVDCLLHDPFDYIIVDQGATKLPARYAEPVKSAAAHYRQRDGLHPTVDAMAREIMHQSDRQTVIFLGNLAAHLQRTIRQVLRYEGEPYSPIETLERGEGACRDSAVLFMDACRSVGLAARFVSGYAWDAQQQDQRELHAWAEVYLPGAGWRGYDPTTGLACANRHIAVAASPTPGYAAPTTGTFTGPKVDSSLDYNIHMTVEERAANETPEGATFAWP
ncbi:transglutaminase family protein [Algisphaera agarilytica]|uniref:Transglutaminase-like putative cysteine protease n=1 Tax=Algisphaera agarilytica TaxID=1385975 RepID=A0A7X0H4B0_9BACT|nr:transglutaminase family protein [Algisphaera agarilytica]MBB6429027.1 transglutaminase-like putative cysteine protease [Algisphaera agarilytica]